MGSVLITGAAGFLGRRLAQALLASPVLTGASGSAEPIEHLVLADRAAVDIPATARTRVTSRIGDLADGAFVDSLVGTRFDSIFHLAASLTLDAERDPSGTYSANVEALRRVIEGAGVPPPRIVFTSSIAAFGGALPSTVDESVRTTPTTTYGTHKAIAELLLADYSRLGRIDGRALRLPIVLTRPSAPTAAVSDRIAAIVREPLAGRDVTCPLAPGARIPIASAGAVVAALIAFHDLPPAALDGGRALNLPALTVRVDELIAAVERRGGGRTLGRVTFAPDASLQRIVDGWPGVFVSRTATRLGLASDRDADALVDDYLAHEARVA